MLGSIGSSNAWQWAVRGKHPVARDYFKVGSKVPILEAFFIWMEKGYQILSSRKWPSAGLCSWRFWAKGSKNDYLVCGVGRDSSDRVGRPYPLLIIGTGPLVGWEDEWDLLPLACERTWSQMEYLSAKRFTDFREFEKEIEHTNPPSSRWSEYRSENPNLSESLSSASGDECLWDRESTENSVASLSRDKELFVPLDSGPLEDPHTLAGFWHYLVKERISDVPNAVFMGGTSARTSLAVFRRALAPTDFVRLWSSEEQVLEVGGEDAGGAVGGHRLDV